MKLRLKILPVWQEWRLAIRSGLILALAAAGAAACFSETAARHESLQVSLSVEQRPITAPFPARVVLHFHNAGDQTLWLYRPLRDAASVTGGAGGSAVAAHLELAPSQGSATSGALIPAVGTLLRFPGFPHPELVALKPGGDAEENAAIRVEPATLRNGGNDTLVWGTYLMSVVYSAGYPNARLLASEAGANVWSGSVLTNAVHITLRPPAPADHGTISGTVTDRDGRLDPGFLVSLADDHDQMLAQVVADGAGAFHFGELPLGRYWVTVRWPSADHNTSFFEHADLSASQPDARMKLIMLNQETYEGKQMLHKPVLIRVTDAGGRGVGGATLKILWSDGSVTENERVETDAMGLAVVSLIPGANYVTVTKRGCPKEEQMASVAPGQGIDGVSVTYNCER